MFMVMAMLGIFFSKNGSFWVSLFLNEMGYCSEGESFLKSCLSEPQVHACLSLPI